MIGEHNRRIQAFVRQRVFQILGKNHQSCEPLDSIALKLAGWGQVHLRRSGDRWVEMLLLTILMMRYNLEIWQKQYKGGKPPLGWERWFGKNAWIVTGVIYTYIYPVWKQLWYVSKYPLKFHRWKHGACNLRVKICLISYVHSLCKTRETLLKSRGSVLTTWHLALQSTFPNEILVRFCSAPSYSRLLVHCLRWESGSYAEYS